MSKIEDRTKLEDIADGVRRQFIWKAQSLRAEAVHLKDQMERLIKECNKAQKMEPYCINSLGVVQGSARDIDRQCGELSVLSEMIGSLKWAMKSEEDEE